jgi:thiol-disulfide isomerase/thioredoxin
MRKVFAICTSGTLLLFSTWGCQAQAPGSDSAPLSTQPAKTTPTAQKLSAPLTAPKPAAFAKLGHAKPVADKTGSRPIDRAAEVQRLITGYESMAIRYVDKLTRATTPAETEAVASRAPSARSIRQYVRLLAEIVAVDQTDEAAFDALVFLSRFVGVPALDEALGAVASAQGEAIDPIALLLQHHANNGGIRQAFAKFPRGAETDAFLRALFEKTFNPEVRWAAGAQLVASHRRNERFAEMEEVVVMMAEDRYLEGVNVGHNLTARAWAANKLREIHTLGVGNVLPEVSGNKLTGGTGNILDYRGKIVVLDIWTTWCGPCVKMIPHQIELTERHKDEPLAILSVSCDRDQETLEEFLKLKPMPWDHWWVGMDSEFSRTLNVAKFPTIYILDGEGTIRFKNVKGEELDEAIDALLAERSSEKAGN